METFHIFPKFFGNTCSYPTYEEWKLNNNFFVSISLTNRSYPTYEEWKPWYLRYKIDGKTSSYPTYEEWKQNKDNR